MILYSFQSFFSSTKLLELAQVCLGVSVQCYGKNLNKLLGQLSISTEYSLLCMQMLNAQRFHAQHDSLLPPLVWTHGSWRECSLIRAIVAQGWVAGVADRAVGEARDLGSDSVPNQLVNFGNYHTFPRLSLSIRGGSFTEWLYRLLAQIVHSTFLDYPEHDHGTSVLLKCYVPLMWEPHWTHSTLCFGQIFLRHIQLNHKEIYVCMFFMTPMANLICHSEYK